MEMKSDVRGEEMQLNTPKIGAEEVRRAMDILKKYKQGKKHLEQRIIDNEQFWKLRHWEQMEKAGEGGNSFDPRPRSGWLVNCILSKHADAMDAYPQPTVLPREADDTEEARRLSRILPVILKNDRFRRTYSDGWWRKLKSGCAVYGVFWDGEKLGGMGDITVRSMDLLNLFWEPGITDVQKSAHFFSTELVDNHKLCAAYPQLKGKLSRSGMTLSRYLYDDAVDTSDKSVVVDWYYHLGDTVQFCKFVGEEVLYATENDPELSARGWYDHGKYPFVFDNLFPEEGTPCGYGYIDLCKSSQKQIDLMNQAILKNTLAAATPRFFIRDDGAVNENEYADWTRPFVHTNGNLGADSIAPIKTAGLDGVYVAYLNHKISEMKETAGNRDVSNGGTAAGVTAATAIAALQESGGKLSRNMIDDSYEAFSYDPAADAAFQSYLKRYTREGKAAMADTMAQGAHLTGGYGSTYAQSAAQQAYNGYLARLSDVLPELQEAAYARYRDDGAALLEQYELLRSRDEADYERYLDSLSAWKSERTAAQKLYDEAAAADRKQYQLLLDYFSDKAKAEAKGEATSATTPAAATMGSTLSSTGAESLMKAMTNYLKKGDTAAAKLLYQRYDGRISPAQRTRFKNLFAGYNVELT